MGDGGAHPHAGLVVHGDSADAGRLRAVQVGVDRVSALQSSGVEGFLHVGPGLVFPSHYGDRTFRAVKVVLDVQVGFGLAEEGQHFQVGPFLVAEGGPPLKILGQTAQIDLAVDGPGAADHFALGDVDLALLVVDGAP